MIGAPFFRVEFADFWLADQLNSLATVLLDLQYLCCFYYTNGNWVTAGGKQQNFVKIIKKVYIYVCNLIRYIYI